MIKDLPASVEGDDGGGRRGPDEPLLVCCTTIEHQETIKQIYVDVLCEKSTTSWWRDATTGSPAGLSQ